MNYTFNAEMLTMTCRRCNQPTGHQIPSLWCVKCRSFQRQRGQARGLARSVRTRRLKAWLKTLGA